jgi:uncharacterized protein YdhG (YjbR/CyaY superfamily)
VYVRDADGDLATRAMLKPREPAGKSDGWARMLDDAHVSAMDDYLDGLPAEQKAALARVRAVVEGVVPDADEGVSYGMPAFLYAGRPLLGFRAAKNHLSVFPFSPAAIEAVEDRLGDFGRSKGTIRFSPDSPLPEDVLADLVRARRDEISKAR